MRRTFSLTLAMMLLICCTCMYAFSSNESVPTLGDVASGNQENQTVAGSEQQQAGTTSKAQKDQEFIAGLTEAGNLASADIQGTKEEAAPLPAGP